MREVAFSWFSVGIIVIGLVDGIADRVGGIFREMASVIDDPEGTYHRDGTRIVGTKNVPMVSVVMARIS